MATSAFSVQPSLLGTSAPSTSRHKTPAAHSRFSGLLQHPSTIESFSGASLSAVLLNLASGRSHQCNRSGQAFSGCPQEQRWRPHRKVQLRRCVRARAEAEIESASETSDRETKGDQGAEKAKGVALDKEVSKVVRKTAATFAPRASTKSKNPATQGTVLYTVFEVQAWVSIVAGFLLSYNLIFPSDRPDIARLLGMWSVWMLAVPSLRARDCSAAEKEALNYLFVLIPVINVLIPVFWKSFAAVFTADCIAMVAMYAWKMEWFAKDDATST